MNGKGFTYMGVLVLLVITGIAMTSASTYWRTVAKREKEKELLFRGDQIRSAIKSYCNMSGNSKSVTYPQRLTDLLKDPRFPAVRRHLRKLYQDPMTEDGKWGLLYDGSHRIRGVYSKSKHKPLKTANFESDYQKSFETAKTYADWKFIYLPESKKPTPTKKSA